MSQLCGVACRCQAAVIKTVARHCTSTSRIARTLALRSASPRSSLQIAVSFLRVLLLAVAAAVSFLRGACGAGALQAGRKSRGSHSTRDRRRRRRHRALPFRPPASRRVFRDVFTFLIFWEVSSCIVLQ